MVSQALVLDHREVSERKWQVQNNYNVCHIPALRHNCVIHLLIWTKRSLKLQGSNY